jgi:uncharacterized protein DUF5691
VRGWEDLVASALLGTDRRPPKPDALPGDVREGLGDEADPARLLLDAAALSATYTRAGRPPLRDLKPLDEAEPDHRPVPRLAATRRLAGMLQGRHRAVLPEWLTVLTEHGWRPPPEYLPALADLARTKLELRETISRAAGPRAAWLAAANPDWVFLDRTLPDDAWEHGTPGQRATWLASTRRTDPDRAREALAATWSSESARSDLLRLFAEGLAAADEPFLEAALDDRARTVRHTAAGLLKRLPGSAYQRRMTDRVRACLSIGPDTLTVTLPAGFDDGMRRDGLEERAPRGTGERAWWLRQLVESAPLAAYPDTGLLDLRVEGYDAEQLWSALTVAVVRERSVDWASALLAHGTLPIQRIAELIATLPKERQAAAVRSAELRTPEHFTFVVRAIPKPWPADLAAAILNLLSTATVDDTWERLAERAAHAVPREALSHPLVSRPPGEEYTWRQRLIETLVFRREMYEEL